MPQRNGEGDPDELPAHTILCYTYATSCASPQVRANAAPTDTRLHDFRATLAEVDRHPNRRYFILKSIIVNNLYVVDIILNYDIRYRLGTEADEEKETTLHRAASGSRHLCG